MENRQFWGSPGGCDTWAGVIEKACVSDTLAPLGWVPACTGAHFRDLLILLSHVGSGRLPEGKPSVREGLSEKGRDLERSKNNETPNANSV